MTPLIGLVAIVVVAWFAAGTIWNVRQGRALLRWMQGGLPIVGRRTTVRWLGSSVVELVIEDAEPPFERVACVIFLEPRDLPWMWPVSRARGRRDTFIVRGRLRRTPVLEFEALDPASWSGRDALPRVPREWPTTEAAGLRVHAADDAAGARAGELVGAAARSELHVRRLSVRRAEPNFQLHVALPDHEASARTFFETVRALAQRAIA